jgi:recombination associated protein RdgC
MLFKNILLYQMVEPFIWDAGKLNDQLTQYAYRACPRSENTSCGWVSPYGPDSDLFAHSLKSFYLIAFCKEEKILPSSVIKEELDKKINAMQQKEERTLYRKEKIALREEIIINLRQQAFSRKKMTYAYIDVNQNWLLIDASSRNKAEEICSYLRKTLGSLKLMLPSTQSQPEKIMTSWLVNKENLPYFKIQNNCDMLDPKQKMSMIKCKEQDLNAQEIINHLHSGKQIVKLTLNWQDKIMFDLSDDLGIKRVKFLDLTQTREEIKNQSDREQLDADFAIMTGEFTQFLQDLWTLFDGLTSLGAVDNSLGRDRKH